MACDQAPLLVLRGLELCTDPEVHVQRTRLNSFAGQGAIVQYILL